MWFLLQNIAFYYNWTVASFEVIKVSPGKMERGSDQNVSKNHRKLKDLSFLKQKLGKPQVVRTNFEKKTDKTEFEWFLPKFLLFFNAAGTKNKKTQRTSLKNSAVCVKIPRSWSPYFKFDLNFLKFQQKKSENGENVTFILKLPRPAFNNCLLKYKIDIENLFTFFCPKFAKITHRNI